MSKRYEITLPIINEARMDDLVLGLFYQGYEIYKGVDENENKKSSICFAIYSDDNEVREIKE